jgi:hypothetical protein
MVPLAVEAPKKPRMVEPISILLVYRPNPDPGNQIPLDLAGIAIRPAGAYRKSPSQGCIAEKA